MSKIVSMSAGAIDPIAQTKRVFWRPTTTGTALKVGDPVCYKLDAVDHKERGAGSTPVDDHLGGSGTTYAEGAQTYTGRLFNVEEPLVDNISAFAGIVKCLGPKAGADGDFIEIFCANSGAVVPANIVLTSTTAGRTLLAVMVGTRTLGSPTQDNPDFLTYSDGDPDWSPGTIDSKVVGIAMETLTAAGLCWVKLDENNFEHQGGQNAQEFLVTSVADDVTVNKRNLNISVSAGHCCALHYRTILSGAGGDGQSGVYRFETIFNAIPGAGKHVFGIKSHLEIGAGMTGHGHISPLSLVVRTKNVDPDLSGCGMIAAIHIEWHLRATTTGTLTNMATRSCIIYVNHDTTASPPEYFLFSENDGGVALTADVVAQDDAAAKSLLVQIGSIEYHIPCYTDGEIA